jgi:hypothetical protein
VCGDASPTIEKCVIRNNSSGVDGAGVYIYFGSNVNLNITGCEIVNNARYGVAALYGKSVSIRNCVIANNNTTTCTNSYGIKLYQVNECHIINCTTVGHLKSSSRGIEIVPLNTSSVVEIKNSILWDNTDDLSAPSGISLSYCCIKNTTDDGVGVIHSDPLFASEGDYHLKSHYGRYNPATSSWVEDTDIYSPCIDTGTPGDDYSYEPDSPAGANGGRVNMGAYGNTNQASKSADSDGDKLSDVWEKYWWPNDAVGSHSPGDDNGVNENSGNGDGFSNLIEYYFNYNPKEITNKGVEFANVKQSATSFDPTKGESIAFDFWVNKSYCFRLKVNGEYVLFDVSDLCSSQSQYATDQYQLVAGHHYQVMWKGKAESDGWIILKGTNYPWQFFVASDGSTYTESKSSATYYDVLTPIELTYNHQITDVFCNPTRIIPVFNEISTISYTTSMGNLAEWPMTITIYDPDGNKFATVIDNKTQAAGDNSEVWNGRSGSDSDSTRRYPSKNGAYTVEVRFSGMRENETQIINLYK